MDTRSKQEAEETTATCVSFHAQLYVCAAVSYLLLFRRAPFRRAQAIQGWLWLSVSVLSSAVFDG